MHALTKPLIKATYTVTLTNGTPLTILHRDFKRLLMKNLLIQFVRKYPIAFTAN